MPSLSVYEREDGTRPFDDWFDALDAQAAIKVTRALARLETGNPGDVKPVGQGVSERRIPFGPGYRVYFGCDGDELVILLCGGTKSAKARISRRHRICGTSTSVERKVADHGTDKRL